MGTTTKIREVMTADPISIDKESTVRDAWRTMKTRGFRHLPVVENGALIGILSTTDVGKLGAQVPTVMARLVGDAMTRDPLTIGEDETIEVAAAKMALKKISCLPVVTDGKLVGIVTTFDLLDALARRIRHEE